MCSHPTSDSCKFLTIGSPATHQILAQLATRILRHGDGDARAHVQRCPTPPLTRGKHVLSDAQPPIPNLNTIGQAVPEVQKRGLHVRTCRDTPPVTCGKHLAHEPQLTQQN